MKLKSVQIKASSSFDTPPLWSRQKVKFRICFQRTLFLPQLLIGQEPVSYQSLVAAEAFEAEVPLSDLEKLENDIENMLKVVEKHLESSHEDEKVWFKILKIMMLLFSFFVNCIFKSMLLMQISTKHNRRVQIWFSECDIIDLCDA